MLAFAEHYKQTSYDLLRARSEKSEARRLVSPEVNSGPAPWRGPPLGAVECVAGRTGGVVWGGSAVGVRTVGQ